MTWPSLEKLSTCCQEGWGSVVAWIYDVSNDSQCESQLAREFEEVRARVRQLGAQPFRTFSSSAIQGLIRLLAPVGNRLQPAAQNWTQFLSSQNGSVCKGLRDYPEEQETAKRLFSLYGGELFSLIDELIHLWGASRFQSHLGAALEERPLSEDELQGVASEIYKSLTELGVCAELLDALTQSQPLVVTTPAIGVSLSAVYSEPSVASQSPEERLTTIVNSLVQSNGQDIGVRLLQRVTGRLLGADYRVPALFVADGRGAVRDVRITILPAGSARSPVVLEFLVSAQQTHADKLRDSVMWGREAALKLLKKQMGEGAVPDYAIRVAIDGAGLWTFDGESLGLAVALALMARVRGEQVGGENIGDTAVTGAILNRQGFLGGVGGIKAKMEAVSANGARVHRVIVPEANVSEALSEGFPSERLIGAGSLEEVLSRAILFDPWCPYLQKLTVYSEKLSKTRQSDSSGTENWDLIWHFDTLAKRNWLLCRSEKQSLFFAHQIAARHAGQRLAARDGNTPSQQRRQPVPVIIEADNWSEDLSLHQVIFNTMRRVMGKENSDQSSDLDESIIGTALRDGQILLVIHGLESAPESFWGRLRRTLEGKSLPLILISTEAAWWCGQEIWLLMDGSGPLKFYQGRATPLDEHARLMKEAILSQVQEWVPDLTSPEEFFQRCYWPLRVVPLDRDFKKRGASVELEEIVRDSQNSRILLLGDGGAGKTTALNKFFLAALGGELLLSHGWPLVPLHFSLGGLGGVENADFYRRARGLPTAFENDLTQINRVPGLLVLLDGLNNVPQRVPRSNLVVGLNDLVARLAPSTDSRFILTCRKQECALPDSLARRLCGREDGEAFQPYELLPLEETTLQSIMGAAPAGQRVLNKMGETASKLLCNPLVLRLACAASENLAESKEPITRDAIYRYAVCRMLERDTITQNVLTDVLPSRELAQQGMAILAALMMENGGLVEIESGEAAVLLLKCVEDERWGAHEWWSEVCVTNAMHLKDWSSSMTPSDRKARMKRIVEEFSKTSLMRANP